MGAGAAWITLMNTLGCEPKQAHSGHSPPVQSRQDVQIFRSRPDLSPPAVEVASQAHGTAPGFLFLAPKEGPGQYGPMILNGGGQLVWFRPVQNEGEYAMDFKVQRYRGEPVLTWWEGRVHGYGTGNYWIFDGSYRHVRQVHAGDGYRGDHHECLITPQDTALITIYNSVRIDLSPLGGSEEGWVLDGIAQEVDIETGEVLFEWHSLDHIGLDESYGELPEDPELSYDYFHINSIDVDYDSNLLVSARKTSTVYKVDRKTGEVIWRLGGKKSDFKMGPGTGFALQHDARRQPDGTITIFDNSAARKARDESRGIVVEIDMDEMSATLVREYAHPDKLFAATQGNAQVLSNGNVFVGWGSDPVFSEFGSDGELLFDARLPPQAESYRTFRFPWSGYPSDRPAVVAERTSKEEVTLYASWNGATEVAAWEVLAGPSQGHLEPVGSVSQSGFETAMLMQTAEPYVAVQAKHRSGRVLGTSKTIRPKR
jgi:hypothetical protein